MMKIQESKIRASIFISVITYLICFVSLNVFIAVTYGFKDGLHTVRFEDGERAIELISDGHFFFLIMVLGLHFNWILFLIGLLCSIIIGFSVKNIKYRYFLVSGIMAITLMIVFINALINNDFF